MLSYADCKGTPHLHEILLNFFNTKDISGVDIKCNKNNYCHRSKTSIQLFSLPLPCLGVRKTPKLGLIYRRIAPV